MKRMKVFMVGLLAILGSCSVVRNAECKRKYVTVVVVSEYGTYNLQVPYCDTLVMRKGQRPDSVSIQFKVQ
jgi:hypothetical protein